MPLKCKCGERWPRACTVVIGVMSLMPSAAPPVAAVVPYDSGL